MNIIHSIVTASLLWSMHQLCFAEVIITGKVLDQSGQLVPNIRVYDSLNQSFSTTTDASGRYSLRVAATNQLEGVMLVANADYTSDSSLYAPAYPAVPLNTNKADIVVVRKPEITGSVKLEIPWVLEHGQEHGVCYSNLVVEVTDSYGLEGKKVYNYTSVSGLCVSNIVFGKEYVVTIDVSPMDKSVLSSVRGVFYDRAVGSTNAFRLLSGSSAQVGITNISYIVESKSQINGSP